MNIGILPLAGATTKLNETQTEVIRLYFYKEMTQTEIIQKSGKSGATVRGILHSAHFRLKKELFK